MDSENKTGSMSKEELKALEDELFDLRANRRISVAMKVRAARKSGNLCDNPEYDAAKEEQRIIENRIDEIVGIFRRLYVK